MIYKKTHFDGITHNKDEIVFSVISYAITGVLSLIAIIPFLHVVSKAFSSSSAVTTGSVIFWPIDIHLNTLMFVLKETIFLNALKNTVIVAILGTIISMLTTITTAYSLSHTNLRGRNVFLVLYIFSMVFYGGIVPAYMVVKTIGLIDTYWALILPFAIVQFNMLVVKNYFEGLPESIEESAKIDGANYVRILVSIICPMSKPVIASISLLYAVNYWNNYFHAAMYTNSASMRTLQIFLRDIISDGTDLMDRIMVAGNTTVSLEGVKAAAVILSIIPIIAIYPFVQRYFVQGITIGSVKG